MVETVLGIFGLIASIWLFWSTGMKIFLRKRVFEIQSKMLIHLPKQQWLTEEDVRQCHPLTKCSRLDIIDAFLNLYENKAITLADNYTLKNHDIDDPLPTFYIETEAQPLGEGKAYIYC